MSGLLTPFLEKVRDRFEISAEPGETAAKRMARYLALRVAQVRWGNEGFDEFLVRTDERLHDALDYFPQLPALLTNSNE